MIWIKRQLLRIIVLGILATGAEFACADPSPPAPASPELQRSILLLGSEDYSVREQATRDLIKMGAPVCSALEPLIQSEDPELRARAFLILQQLYSGKDLSGIDAAQEVLERLRAETVPLNLRLRAETILLTFEKGLEERAIQRLLENGAILFPTENSTLALGAPPGLAPRRESPVEYSLFLGSKWKGADDKLMLDLKRIRWTFLYYSTRARINLVALQEFPKNSPRKKVEPRGEAQLGVTSTDVPDDQLPQPDLLPPVPHVVITRVLKGSAADDAGLKEGDEILGFEGHSVREFKKPFMSLIELIAKKDAGDKISIQIKSPDGTERTVTPVLKGWVTRLR